MKIEKIEQVLVCEKCMCVMQEFEDKVICPICKKEEYNILKGELEKNGNFKY